ncbi:MAG: nucleotide exchange factor GrpE, partial [Nanoarchaeota archaeon]|nr:nucleotide exchange factor GrpE [Nanoarchaeota archaeon]
VKGIEMIYAQLFSTLESEGLKPIEASGKKFDPYLHDVMLKQKSDKEDGIVLEELQRGYMLNDKVLRHSKVKISEKEEKREKTNEKSQ